MINTIERKFEEIISHGRKQIIDIKEKKKADNGEVFEDMRILANKIKVYAELHPDSSCVRVTMKREYDRDDYQNDLEFRACPARDMKIFEQNYCENPAKCVWHKFYHDPNSTAGDGMRTSIAYKGEKANAFECSVCSGCSDSCKKYVPAPRDVIKSTEPAIIPKEYFQMVSVALNPAVSM